MKKFMYFLLGFVLMAALVLNSGCATSQLPIQLSEDDPNSICENAEGWEYVCYNDAQCRSYLDGYAAVIKERFMAQERGWFTEGGDKQKVNINLFYDHMGIYIIGYIVATREGDRVWLQVTTWACDVELNLIEEPGTLGGWAEWTL